MPHRGVTFAVSLLLLSALIAGGCKSGGGKNGATPTSTVKATLVQGTATATPPAQTPTPAPDIRQEDFAQVSAVSNYIAMTGGEVATDLITYIDLTEDGVDDAVVPISSGGEGGEIAIFVYGYGPGGLTDLLRVIPESGLKDNIVDGKLTITEPQFAPGDPMCCPSQLRVTTYGWNGAELVVENQRTEQTVQN